MQKLGYHPSLASQSQTEVGGYDAWPRRPCCQELEPVHSASSAVFNLLKSDVADKKLLKIDVSVVLVLLPPCDQKSINTALKLQKRYYYVHKYVHEILLVTGLVIVHCNNYCPTKYKKIKIFMSITNFVF